MFGFVILLIAVTPSLCYSSAEIIQRSTRSIMTVTLETFKLQNLDCHNKYRRMHGVKPLMNSDKLNMIAQKYAEFLANRDGDLKHSKNGYGENLFMSRGYILDGINACENWYGEETDYDYSKNNPDGTKMVGHFTQMVSRASCFVGIGVAKSKSGYYYVVANYDPHGNIEGKYKENVFPPGYIGKKKFNPFELLMFEPVCYDADRESYLKQNLDCHNVIRRMHGVPPLVYKSEMNDYALKHANWMALESKRLISGNSPYEECSLHIAGAGGKINGYEFCQFQYKNELKFDVDFFHSLDKNTLENPARCFSQMIWKSTRYIGFAMARSNDNSIYLVVVYDPRGNMRGLYKTNILPLRNITSSLPSTNEWDYNKNLNERNFNLNKSDLNKTNFRENKMDVSSALQKVIKVNLNISKIEINLNINKIGLNLNGKQIELNLI